MVEWRKSVGDEVSEDEVIAVVETDKVSVDVRSTHVGVVVKLFAAVDDVVSQVFLPEALDGVGIALRRGLGFGLTDDVAGFHLD